jgi:hypothetical protein
MDVKSDAVADVTGDLRLLDSYLGADFGNLARPLLIDKTSLAVMPTRPSRNRTARMRPVLL